MPSRSRSILCPDAGTADAAFAFEPISPLRPADWQIYWKRAVRYGRRHYEFQLLRSGLKSRGLAGLPADITELYSQAENLQVRWQGIYTLTNLVALRQMRRIGRARGGSGAG